METTLDAVFRGALELEQPKRGYRFNIDSVLLSSFTIAMVTPPASRIVDLGAGCGVIGLLLARQWGQSRVTLVELQEDLAQLAQKNVLRNQLTQQAEVIAGDLRHPRIWSACGLDLVVCNPPFFKLNAGRMSPRPQISRAKHEVTCTLPELLQAASSGLPARGKLSLIYPTERLPEMLEALRQWQLGVHCLRRIIPLPGRASSRVLLLAEKGYEGPATELAPLMVESKPGTFTHETRRALGD
jgi:tRNA1Val (adenine37-N6)-methyltransferase